MVIAEAERIFALITKLEEVVVFLDEIDEMFRERGEAKEMGARFITTAMLPKLSEVRDTRRIVFIVATNYIEGIDEAIRRQGRFDEKLAILPPCLKEHRVHNELSEVMRVLFDFMAAHHESEAAKLLERLLPLTTFLERERIATQAAGALSKGPVETLDWLQKEFLETHDEVLTLFRHTALPKDVADKFRAFPFREDLTKVAGASELDLFPEEVDAAGLTSWIDDQQLARLVYPKKQSWAHKSMVNESYMR